MKLFLQAEKFIYFFCTLLLIGTINLTGQNLVQNPVFENWIDENRPEGFVVNGEKTSKETTIVYEGSNSIGITAGTNGFYQEIPVTPGKTYLAGFWYYDNDPLARNRAWSTWRDGDGGIVTPAPGGLQPSTYSSDSEDWQFFSAEVIPPPGAVYLRYEIRVYNVGDGGGINYFDALSLEEVDSQVALPIITPAGGTYEDEIEVSMTTATDGATIYYNFIAEDADEAEWIEYIDPITIIETTTIWAVAKKDGLDHSDIVSVTYNFAIPLDGFFTTTFSVSGNWTTTSGGTYGLNVYKEGPWTFSAESTIRDSDNTFNLSDYTFRNRDSFTITHTDAVSGIGGFSIYIRNWSVTSDRKIQLSLNGGVDFETIGTINASWFPDNDNYYPFTYYFSDGIQDLGAGDLQILITGAPNNSNRMRIGGFAAYDVSKVSPVSFSPNGGEFILEQNVTLSSPTNGATIYYKDTEEGVWVLYEDAIAVSETTTLWAYAEKADMDHSDVTSATFTFPEVVDIPDIATLRTGSQDGTLYRLTGEAIVTFVTNTRNQKYIEDATGAILIDDAPGHTTDYQNYDGIKDAVGSLTVWDNMLQFTIQAAPEEPSSSNNSIEPAEISLLDLTVDYEARFVKILQVTIDATGNFEGFTSYTLKDNDETTGIMRTSYSNVGYIGDPIPQTAQNITGVVQNYLGDAQLVPRFLSDFEEAGGAVSMDGTEISSIEVFPNPVQNHLTIVAPEVITSVEVFNTIGSLVTSIITNSTEVNLPMGGLPGGIYLVRITTASGNVVLHKVVKQ